MQRSSSTFIAHVQLCHCEQLHNSLFISSRSNTPPEESTSPPAFGVGMRCLLDPDYTQLLDMSKEANTVPEYLSTNKRACTLTVDTHQLKQAYRSLPFTAIAVESRVCLHCQHTTGDSPENVGSKPK